VHDVYSRGEIRDLDGRPGPVSGQGPIAGRTFTTRSNGVGDFTLTGIVPVVRDKDRHYLVSLGIGFPTGSIDEKDNTPLTEMFGMPPAQLPYPMQLGSGSFELRPGVVLNHIAFTHFDFGARGSAKIRLDRNEHGYRLGEEYEVTAWAALLVSESLSASFRLAWKQRFDIHGSDDELMTRVPLGPLSGTKVVPTAFPKTQGFRRLYGYWGINLMGGAEDGWLQGLRIAAEVGFPFWQSLDGPQLRDRIMATVGLQYSF